MKIFTQIGFLDIIPATVASIKPGITLPGNNLPYTVVFKDELCIDGHYAVSISEADAAKLSELSGIKISGNDTKGTESQKTLFVTFKKLLILNEWEKTFDYSHNP